MNAYYKSLVQQERIQELLELLNPTEQADALELILKTLDHAVMETALHHLPAEHHESFLELCQEKYHDETLLVWLEDRSHGISVHLEATISTAKSELRILLETTEE